MTKDEQTIANLKKLKSFHNGSYGADIDRAIEALIQRKVFWKKAKIVISQLRTDRDRLQNILDKTRAEIKELANKIGNSRGYGQSVKYGLCAVLEIIDKYTTERENI